MSLDPWKWLPLALLCAAGCFPTASGPCTPMAPPSPPPGATADEFWQERIRVLSERADAAEEDAPQEAFDALLARGATVEAALQRLGLSEAEQEGLRRRYEFAARQQKLRLARACERSDSVSRKLSRVKMPKP